MSKNNSRKFFPKSGLIIAEGFPRKNEKETNLYDIYPLAIRSRRIRQRNHSQPDRSHPGTRLCQCAAAYQSGEGKEDILRSDLWPYHQGADHDGRWKGYRLRADAPHHR